MGNYLNVGNAGFTSFLYLQEQNDGVAAWSDSTVIEFYCPEPSGTEQEWLDFVLMCREKGGIKPPFSDSDSSVP